MPEEQETQTQETPSVETPPPEQPPEETPEVLKSRLAELNKQLEEAKKGLSTAHQTLTKKDQELKRQADLRSEIEEIKGTLKVYVGLFAEMGQAPVDDPEAKQKTVEKFNQAVVELETKAKQREYASKANEVWGRTQSLGLTEEDDDYWTIRDALQAGNLERAAAKVAKLEKSKSAAAPPPPPAAAPPKAPTETEEERINRLAEEKAQAILKGSSLYKSDTAVPSGRGLNKAAILKQLAEGRMDADAMAKARELHLI